MIELIVVIAIVGLLAGLVTPALTGARQSSLRTACASNLRQLAMANIAYATDHGTFVAAAEDVWGKNLKRWHGARAARSQAFSVGGGAAGAVFRGAGSVKECPSFRVREPGFEAGCGGYGYNARGVGSQAYLVGNYAGAGKGMPPEGIADPSRTVMFTDAAFLSGASRLIEYSFAEAFYHLADAKPVETYQATPSIHFRHGGLVGVVWVDGRVSAEAMSIEFNQVFTDRQIGWFGPPDNSLFDPY